MCRRCCGKAQLGINHGSHQRPSRKKLWRRSNVQCAQGKFTVTYGVDSRFAVGNTPTFNPGFGNMRAIFERHRNRHWRPSRELSAKAVGIELEGSRALPRKRRTKLTLFNCLSNSRYSIESCRTMYLVDRARTAQLPLGHVSRRSGTPCPLARRPPVSSTVHFADREIQIGLKRMLEHVETGPGGTPAI